MNRSFEQYSWKILHCSISLTLKSKYYIPLCLFHSFFLLTSMKKSRGYTQA